MNNLIGRVQNILLTPKTEWPMIAAEAETIGWTFTPTTSSSCRRSGRSRCS